MDNLYKQDITKSLPKSWNVDEVCEWLEAKDLGSLVNEFKKQQIDGKALFLLQPDDFQQLVPQIGPRRKLEKEIQELLTSF